jgi:HD superfamily phosphohydrolase
LFLTLSFKEKIDESTYLSFPRLLAAEIQRQENGSKESKTIITRLEGLKRSYAKFSDEKLFHPFMSDAVSNTICADLFDYLARDYRNLGMEARSHGRLLRYFLIRPGSLEQNEGMRLSVLVCRPDKGGQRRDVATSILDIMRERYHLVERVFYHHKKAAAAAMLAKLYEICLSKPKDDEQIYPAPWNQEQTQSDVKPARPTVPHVIHLSDHDFVEYLGHCKVTEGSQNLQRRLYLGIRYRKLYRTLLVVDMHLARKSIRGAEFFAQHLWGAADDHSLTEQALNNRMSLESDLSLAAYTGQEDKNGSVLIYCPSGKMQSKEIDVRVELQSGTVRPLRRESEEFSLKGDIRVLTDYYKELWRMYLFVEPALYEDDLKCLEVIKHFAEKYEIPIEEAIQKSRKPHLIKLYEAGLGRRPFVQEIELPLPEYHNLQPLAARDEVGQESRSIVRELDPVSAVALSDKQFFRGVIPKLGNCPRQDEDLEALKTFFSKRGFGSFRDHADFLMFLDRTYEHWRYPATRVFTDNDLDCWFREHNDGNRTAIDYGSKL